LRRRDRDQIATVADTVDELSRFGKRAVLRVHGGDGTVGKGDQRGTGVAVHGVDDRFDDLGFSH
jgi:hypothetical protein